jgi:uncharacterized protein (TIGR03437 family)
MIENPSGYYLNVHTTANPGGAIRGQLERAEMIVLMGQMSPANEVPPVDLNASAVSSVIALRTLDSAGNFTSGQVIFDVNYTFPSQVTFTGLHIHPAPAGVNGPVAINSALASGTASAQSGVGNLHFEAEVPATNAAARNALNGLFDNPGGYYINVHTSVNTGGAARAQLRRTDRAVFQVSMLTGNENPPIAGLDASAPAAVTVHTLRNADGTVAAATTIFDVNPRFPAAVEFTGLHIHNGTATENGPVTINTGLSGSNPIASDGFGNIYRVVTSGDANGLATVNSLVRNPENHYVNLHSRVNPGGVVRAQLAPANTSLPSSPTVISAISDPARRTLAPGGLMTVFGSNLTKVPGDSSGFDGLTVPVSLNGVEVTIGGQRAPILVLTPGYLVAQVPVDAQPGMQPLVVRNANGAGAAVSTEVANTAPAIFLDSVGGIVAKNAGFSLVRPENPARAGEILVIYSTGLGQTTPPLSTGQIVSFPPASNTAPVTVTIGGRSAEVIYSLASPGFAGLYQTAVRMPAGVAPGNAPLVLTVGGATSNTVNIAAQ